MVCIQQATAKVMQGMAKPLKIHQLRLGRVVRYWARSPVEVRHYVYQGTPGVLDEICDSDLAGDALT